MILIAFFVLVYAAIGAIAWRRPLLARLAIREAVRRPWQSVLVVAGLTIGTSMILMSSIMSDSVTTSLSLATYQSWGRVDILVSANGRFFSPSIASELANSSRLHDKLRGAQAGVELFGVAADLDRRLDNPTAFANGEDLVCFHIGEALDLLCSRPLNLDYIDNVNLPHAEVQTQVSL